MSQRTFAEELRVRKRLIGMIHVAALPGTPQCACSVSETIDLAVREAEIYRDCGIDAVMIENMHDVPYVRNPGAEVIAMMSIIGSRIAEMGLACGIQVLAGANREALACAHAAGLSFVRVEGFVYAHVADEGILEACAGDLLRYRRQLGAERVAVFADIKKKHASHAITADINIAGTAETAQFFAADGVIVTGPFTGAEALVEDLVAVRAAVTVPVLIGSGLTAANLARYVPYAEGFIVGSYVKEGGNWRGPVSAERVRRLVDAFHAAL